MTRSIVVTISMVECDNCGEDVRSVWRHREYEETMTHRRIQWVCADCHPSLADARPKEARVTTGGNTSA